MSIDKQKIPDCKRQVTVTLKQVAREETVRCSCGCSMKLVDQGGGAKKTIKALDDFEKQMKNLFK